MFKAASAKRSDPELARLRVFGACSSRELRHIERLGTRIDVGRGRVLCRQGDLGRECFIVVEGRATTTVDGRYVDTVGPGEVIGEIALLSQRSRRVATVTTETPMTLLVLTRTQFASLLAVAPSVARFVLRATTERLVPK